MRIAKSQSVCEWAGVEPVVPLPRSKLGLAIKSLGSGPIHGLRHPPTDDTSGWYIWCGELSKADDFFSPMHVEHLEEYIPLAVEYLWLPPGYRFIIDGGNFEDVWFDAALLEV